MKRIGLISDTHGCFDATLKGFLSGVDEIWHAGDFGDEATADAIAAFRPLRGVHGNIDGGSTRITYPEFALWECEGVRVLMTHQGGYPGRYNPRALEKIRECRPGLFLAGHSHILKVMYDRANGMLFMNPGAAGIVGFHKVRTAIRFTVDGGAVRELEVGEWPR